MSASPPPMPSGLLVQSVYIGEEGEESGWRVWADGRHESRRDGAPWEVVSTLDADRLAAVREALDDGSLEEIAGIHRGAEGPRQGATLWFQALSRGEPHSVGLVGGAHLDALDALTARLVTSLAGPDFPFV
ncbi:MAG: hypothetical protein QOH00_2374 [Gaiellales bacterium]|jgi:hypothetical protein|nr:hypothetical protein [Gaiellales bacterium]